MLLLLSYLVFGLGGIGVGAVLLQLVLVSQLALFAVGTATASWLARA